MQLGGIDPHSPIRSMVNATQLVWVRIETPNTPHAARQLAHSWWFPRPYLNTASSVSRAVCCPPYRRGELFSELPLDPRWSEFVAQSHERHGLLETAAAVAAVVSAPGSIFFMGGTDKAKKDEARRKISSGQLAD